MSADELEELALLRAFWKVYNASRQTTGPRTKSIANLLDKRRGAAKDVLAFYSRSEKQ